MIYLSVMRLLDLLTVVRYTKLASQAISSTLMGSLPQPIWAIEKSLSACFSESRAQEVFKENGQPLVNPHRLIGRMRAENNSALTL
ncbi:hypothetical protein BH10CHL1_BH10CHL1_36800 [soil metagenome]